MRLGLALAAMSVALVSFPVTAHDFWINRGGYKDRMSGIHCCGPADCFSVTPARITVIKDGYLVDGTELVPFSEAYVSEDRDYWRCQKSDGSRRCFFAPAMGS